MRIIAGKCRGRTFQAPEGLRTRPTLDRVKESFFGSIQFEIAGATVLDLFSGSGNIALEAASRGAKRCVCSDINPECTALIKKNAAALGLTDVLRVITADFKAVLSLLHEEGFCADIVYLDAPYASGLSQEAAAMIFETALLSPGGRLFVEHSGDVQCPAHPLYSEYRTKKYGKCFITELRWSESDENRNLSRQL